MSSQIRRRTYSKDRSDELELALLAFEIFFNPPILQQDSRRGVELKREPRFVNSQKTTRLGRERSRCQGYLQKRRRLNERFRALRRSPPGRQLVPGHS